jgi:hypothetical protein
MGKENWKKIRDQPKWDQIQRRLKLLNGQETPRNFI